MHNTRFFVFVALAAIFIAGCLPGHKSTDRVTFPQLVNRLMDLQSLARLDLPGTTLLSSYDPAGSNDDYNHPLRQGPAGWWVLADLKGPGYVSRFWFTGGAADHAIRLYFDNEKTPRLATTIGQFCGKQAPFIPPLAANENYCWYNYVPLPYARRLVVMVQAGGDKPGGWPRLFHQINYTTLPKGTCVESFPGKLDAEAEQALSKVRKAWDHPGAVCQAGGGTTNLVVLNLGAGQRQALPVIMGPAMIREMRVTPQALAPALDCSWNNLLRDVILRISWDDASASSVEAPLGDFFGSVWRRAAYQSMYFGLNANTLISRLPMPFAKAARMEFENQGANALSLSLAVISTPLAQDGRYGYLHAAWRRSAPQDVGKPHEILTATGLGRYAGCILSATTLDKSYWMLEGDELMWRDDEKNPFWRGTGLEDYFNGGWYYQNVLARPLHGLTFKTFFRTVQYRLHLPDPVMFAKSFRMVFERGPDNASHGWMESLAYYYLDRPCAAPTTLSKPADRSPPEDQFSHITVMPELFNYERFGDYAGAQQFIDFFLGKYPGFPFADMLRLRQVAYTETMQGFAAAQPLYANIITTVTNAAVQQQARLLAWFHEKPTHSLLGVYCSAATRIYLDGRLLGEAGGPDRMQIIGLELHPGRHVLALQSQYHPYPFWVQAYLRRSAGAVFTSPSWKYKVNPTGAWTQPDYDDRDWIVAGGTGVKGPPEEPYLWVEPNALVDMQSRAIGCGAAADWPDKSKPMVYRHVFDVP